MSSNDIPVVGADDLAWVTAAQMRDVDRVAMQLGHDLRPMMELAGDRLARLILATDTADHVTVLAGPGGNGGGGLAAARHLHNAGVPVTVRLSSTRLSSATEHQCRLLRAMGIPIAPPSDPPERIIGTVIDALVGYSLHGPLRPRVAQLAAATASSARVYALDLPSGVHPDTGDVDPAAVRADVTMTLALPKVGLRTAGHTGELRLADIGIPRVVYDDLGISPAPDFRAAPLLRIVR